MFDFFKKKPREEQLSQSGQNNEAEKKGFWEISVDSFKKTISKTSETLVGNIVHAVEKEEEFDEFILEDMEDMLIKADIGVDSAMQIVEKIRRQNIKPAQVKQCLKEEFNSILTSTASTSLNYEENDLNIYLITGVNGAGKTTFIGKLAHRFTLAGKKVLVAAGDTFRAAAEEQLDIWAQRAGADIVRKDGADPASVVFDAIKKAKEERYDVVLIDTAGRLQNKFNLMQELGKIKATIDKNAQTYLRESILVIDANTGQNGLQQAKVFKEAAGLTSVVLTKLDGSAKGGIVIAIAKELELPVKLVGVGEKISDLKDFNQSVFIDAIFGE